MCLRCKPWAAGPRELCAGERCGGLMWRKSPWAAHASTSICKSRGRRCVVVFALESCAIDMLQKVALLPVRASERILFLRSEWREKISLGLSSFAFSLFTPARRSARCGAHKEEPPKGRQFSRGRARPLLRRASSRRRHRKRPTKRPTRRRESEKIHPFRLYLPVRALLFGPSSQECRVCSASDRRARQSETRA